MAQHQIAQPMTPSNEIRVGVFAGTAQVPNRLVFLGGRMNLGEQAGAEQLRELAGVAAIRLDPLAGLARNQRRSHHHAHHLHRPDPPLQCIATRPCFVTEPDLALRRALDLLHHAPNRRLVVARLSLDRLSLARQQHRHVDRFLMCVQPDVGDTFLHDRLLSYAALVPLCSVH